MPVFCKVENADCPRNLQICCGVCEFRTDCKSRCLSEYATKPDTCPDGETIDGGLTPFESAGALTIQKIGTLMRLKKELEDQEKQLKEQLVKAMEAYGIKSFENDLIKMTYVAPTTRSTIDSAKLKKDHPDIVQQYSKTSNVSASVRVTVK